MANLCAYKRSTLTNYGLKQLDEEGLPKSVTLKDLPYTLVHLQIMKTVNESMEEQNETVALIRLYSGVEGISIRSIEVSENPAQEADAFEFRCHRFDIEDWLESYRGPTPAERVIH